MLTGYHVQTDTPAPADPLGAATFLDVGGYSIAANCGQRAERIYFTGRPDPASVAVKVRAWGPVQGQRFILGNEPNLADEDFGGGPADYAAWFLNVVSRLDPSFRCYYAGMSPGVPGWQTWYTDPAAQAAITQAAGICVHTYGDLAALKDIVWWIHQQYPDKPLWISEWNWGAGREIPNVDAWVDATVAPFLDWCATIPQIEAATWFSYVWDQSSKLPTSVDAKGTSIERALTAWREKPAVAETMQFADVANYQGEIDMSGWKAAGIDGVIIRLSEDGSPNDQYGPANWRQAKKCGLRRAAYHVCDPRFASPAASLERLGNAIIAAGGADAQDGIVADIELGNPGDQSTWMAEWGSGALTKFGGKALLYSAPWWLKPHGLEIEGVAEQFAGLWDAFYTGDPNARPPEVPGWKKLVMVQWTANGSLPGVQGNVDLDEFLGGPADWAAVTLPAAWPAAAPPPPVVPGVDNAWRETYVWSHVYAAANNLDGMPGKTEADQAMVGDLRRLLNESKVQYGA